jgi:hypothetical protein
MLLVFQDVDHQRMDAIPPVAIEFLNSAAAEQRV